MAKFIKAKKINKLYAMRIKIKKEKYQHLINNLERTTSNDSIFNYESGKRAFLTLGQGNIHEWLESLLPNTRLIIEPKIIGSSIGIQYINGKITKAIDKNSEDITENITLLSSIPTSIPINKKLEIRGVLYQDQTTIDHKKTKEITNIKIKETKPSELRFCAFQIFNCNINHFQTLEELRKLNFEIPQNQFTNFISDFEIYHRCWKEGKLFQSYPSSGIVLKINSRKLQKSLGENNVSVHWAYAINQYFSLQPKK